MSRPVDKIRQALATFAGCKTEPALIGGLALAAHDVVRGTRDVDFLIDAEDAGTVHDALLALGYECIHRSEDAANYLRGNEGLNLLYARRPVARGLLERAETHDTPMGRLRVVSAEGLIGFKLQALVNAPQRGRDRQDILDLLRAGRGKLDMQEVRKYFDLLGREALLDKTSGKSAEPGLFPFAGPAVMSRKEPVPTSSGLSDWVELMEVIEALCPVWPARPAIREEGAVYKL